MKMNNTPLSRKENIVVQELENEILIYDLSENKALCLNETSALIWQLCDGNNSIAQISEKLSKKLNSSVSEDLVWLALDQLKKEKLITNGEEFTANFNGMNRREVIRKVGFASMIALPLVSSIIAPSAANAQSVAALLPENAPCTAASQCAQNPTFGTQCCTGANAPVSPANPRVCRAAGVGFNCI